MSEMKLIMERWDRFLLLENLDQIKDNPKNAAKVIQSITKSDDKEEIQKALRALAADPEIKKVAQLFLQLKKEQDPTEEVQEEGALTSLDLTARSPEQAMKAVYDAANEDLVQTPIGRALMKYGPAVLGLGVILALGGAGGVEQLVDPEIGLSVANVVKAVMQAKPEDAIEQGFGALATFAAKRDVEQ